MRYLKTYIHWFILVAGFCATAWAALFMHRLIEKQTEDAFRLRLLDLQTAIVLRLGRYEDILFGVAGLFHVNGEVTPAQFNAYGEALSIKKRFPALDVINYAQYVQESELGQFVKAFDSITGTNGRLLSLQGRNEYMVLTRVYPSSLSMVLGVDVLSASGGRMAQQDSDLRHSREWRSFPNKKPYSSGLPILTRGKTKKVLAARLGVYNGERLLGTAGIGFEIATFFAEAAPNSRAADLHYVVTNVGRADGPRLNPILVFDSAKDGGGFNSAGYGDGDLLKGKVGITFGGTAFQIDAAARKEMKTYERLLPSSVLAVGAVFFMGIAVLVKRIMLDNTTLDDIVNARTRELQIEISTRKGLEMELAAVIESERTRIGRELHDDLGQRLTGISLSAEIIAQKLKPIEEGIADQVNAIGVATHDAMIQIRALAHGLMPVSGERQGLMEALEHLAANTTKSAVIRCTFEIDAPVEIEEESVSAHLYRIAQEALNNAIRHANATAVEIRLDEVRGKIELTITDNGRGFDMKRSTGGMGLSTISHRAAIIGYRLNITSMPGMGTVVRVTQC